MLSIRRIKYMGSDVLPWNWAHKFIFVSPVSSPVSSVQWTHRESSYHGRHGRDRRSPALAARGKIEVPQYSTTVNEDDLILGRYYEHPRVWPHSNILPRNSRYLAVCLCRPDFFFSTNYRRVLYINLSLCQSHYNIAHLNQLLSIGFILIFDKNLISNHIRN